MEYINQVFELKTELDKFRPISKEQEARIMQKFRLDWNYHSNHLEGNSLTFGETKTLLMHGITAGGKPLKDSLEIKGHNEAIKLVEEVVLQDRPLTENFIRELHVLLLKESYEIDAITPDGKQTKKIIEVGKYKASSNHVKTKTGEIFHFAEPFEVPSLMTNLLTQYKVQSKKKDTNPVILAATFHYEFIRIHPFDDGNGRMARILMNFTLMRFGFPPVIIKTEDRENYFSALRQADGGALEKFIEYIAKNLVRSLEIMIAGAKGEEIEELSDLDKKIALLGEEFKGQKNKPVSRRSKENILKIYDDSVVRFYDKFIIAGGKFEQFYVESAISLENESGKNASPVFRKKVDNDTELLEIEYIYKAMKVKDVVEVNFSSKFWFEFNLTNYCLVSHALSKKIIKNYDEQITNEEIDGILKAESERHLKTIQEMLRNPN
jgi:Fic family protein